MLLSAHFPFTHAQPRICCLRVSSHWWVGPTGHLHSRVRMPASAAPLTRAFLPYSLTCGPGRSGAPSSLDRNGSALFFRRGARSRSTRSQLHARAHMTRLIKDEPKLLSLSYPLICDSKIGELLPPEDIKHGRRSGCRCGRGSSS